MAEIAIPIAVLGGMYIISNKNNKKENFKSQINNYVKPPIINYPNEVGVLFNILRGHIKTWTFPCVVKTKQKVIILLLNLLRK